MVPWTVSMAATTGRKRRFVAIAYLLFLHGLTAFLLLYYLIDKDFVSGLEMGSVGDPTSLKSVPTPLPVPSILADLGTPESSATQQFIVPVMGVQPEQLSDSFLDTRDGDRGHGAIDIPAAEGTPVIASADGIIARFFDSIPGGITIYQLTDGDEYVLYYAHLQKRAEGLHVGDKVKQGQTIGYVGDSGNASPGNYHLHFSIARVRDRTRYWEGDYLNPYELLRRAKP